MNLNCGIAQMTAEHVPGERSTFAKQRKLVWPTPVTRPM